jgi:hypothetical protein
MPKIIAGFQVTRLQVKVTGYKVAGYKVTGYRLGKPTVPTASIAGLLGASTDLTTF